MGVIFKTDERRIIPRWRNISIASNTGELVLLPTKSKLTFVKPEVQLFEQKASWERYKDLPHAGDLLSSAFVFGTHSEYQTVAKFILKKELDTNSPLVRLANMALNIDSNNSEIDKTFTSDFIDQCPDQEIFWSEIRKLKIILRNEPRNPIVWIELGRLYSRLGQIEKAKICVDTAVFLDKNNRYIVRSGSRFYHHIDDDEKALQTIKRSEFAKYDPWLISAEIAYSSLLERHSTLTKYGIEIYNNLLGKNYFAITELASALGTVELSKDKLKEARRYFRNALIQPNDNSLAQINWMARIKLGIDTNSIKEHIPFAFESKSISSYYNKDYDKSFEYAIKWFNDEPYSPRPIKVASYIARTYLNDLPKSIKLLKCGLKINPKDIILINDLTYDLILNNQLDEAIKVFSNIVHFDINSFNIHTRIPIIATMGLILFRQKNYEKGRDFYSKALSLTKKINNDYLYALALANLTREEILSKRNLNELDLIINQLKEACKTRDEDDVKILYKKVMSDYELVLKER
jgi:tetratricopeptide (TPR) repeat protein